MTRIESLTPDDLSEMILKENTDRSYHALSKEDLEPLRRYVDEFIPPGGFLEAVLRNNLKDALGRADLRNRRRVFEYVEWLYNEAPATCWGSDQKYEVWLSRKG